MLLLNGKLLCVSTCRHYMYIKYLDNLTNKGYSVIILTQYYTQYTCIKKLNDDTCCINLHKFTSYQTSFISTIIIIRGH